MCRTIKIKEDLEDIRDALKADRDRCIQDGLVNPQALTDMCDDRLATLDYMLDGLARLDAVERILDEFYADERCDYYVDLSYFGRIQKAIRGGTKND